MLLMVLTLSHRERRRRLILDDFAENYRAPRGDSRPIDLLRAGQWMILLK